MSLLIVRHAIGDDVTADALALADKISSSGNEDYFWPCAAMLTHVGQLERAASLSEERFEQIEGSENYPFYAQNGIGDVTCNDSLEVADGSENACLAIGDLEYRSSTLDSVTEDIEQQSDSIEPGDYLDFLMKAGQGYARLNNTSKVSEIIAKAISVAGSNPDLIENIAWNCDEEIAAPDDTCSGSCVMVPFVVGEDRAKVIEMVKSHLSGDSKQGCLEALGEG
jgi:hypothetical protein